MRLAPARRGARRGRLSRAPPLPRSRFLPWSLLGTAVWAATFTLVGYAFHRSFSAAAGAVTQGALAVAVLAAALLGVRALRRRRLPARA